MSYSISISTYFGEKTQPNRINLFKKSILSLSNTNFDGKCFIVDDGSTSLHHIDYLQSLNDNRFIVHKKPTNGGVSKCKNTCIRLILESGCDIGFLADDDLIYSDGWDKKYEEAISKTGISHFCLNVTDLNKRKKMSVNNFEIMKTTGPNGCFLTFTKKMIDTIGNFVNMPYRYGHEHVNFYIRANKYGFCPYICDIVDSENYIKYPPEAWDECSIDRDNEGIKKNRLVATSKISGKIIGEE